MFRFFLQRLVVGIGVVSFVLVVTQDFQIFPVVVTSLLTKKGSSPALLPEGVQSRFISTSDGERIESWHVGGNLSAGPIALIFHGNGETVESVLHIQRWLSQRGIASYSIDYRGYGRSTGWPSEAGLYRDVEAFVRYVQSEQNASNRPFILWGSSIGTGFAAYASTILDSKALVLLAPYSNLRQ
ncbi:MAG: alpha/beta fold hydrolase, partial [Proteobacteria bacterium]|nr:alpha/beta fold hydrolase [Pseudomonadota bacterium]